MQWFACGSDEQFIRLITPSMLMDFSAKPIQQLRVVAALQLVRDVGMCLKRCLIELRAENVADGIALKGSTDVAGIPVNVLETTLAVSLRLDA